MNRARCELVRPEIFRRGDVEPDATLRISDATLRISDATLRISDAIRTLGFLFLDDAELPCPDAADWNDDGRLDLSDPVGMLGWLSLGEWSAFDLECDTDGNTEDSPLPACVYPLDTCR